jgi:integrase
MSVRKRVWTTRLGVEKEAWVADYVDQHGERHLKTFKRKKEADAFADNAGVEVRQGFHAPVTGSLTLADAGKLWIATAERNGLENTTIDQYRQHLGLHIVPYLGRIKLAHLTAPMVREFEDKLLRGTAAPDEAQSTRRSPAMAKKVLRSLGSLIAEAQERGLVARNVVRDLRGHRRRGKERRAERRQKGKLKVGVDIPTRDEIKAIIANLDGRWRPILLTAIFTGLRASELRGLRWSDIDFKRRELHVTQRADRYNEVGRPKSESGERTLPLTPIVIIALREWKLICPKHKGELLYMFPNGSGNIENHANILRRGFMPAQIAAAVTEQALDRAGVAVLDMQGQPIMRAKYTGLHALRHFYASWCINRRADGGLELPAKLVQERLGHSSIVMTMDVYGHLVPRGDDSLELEAAERLLLE